MWPPQTAAEWNRFKRAYDFDAQGGSSEHPTYRNQSEQRSQVVALDQFGRPWLVTIDRDSGDPSGPILPCRAEPQWAGVADADIPPHVYVGHSDGRVTLDLKRWAEDRRKRALSEWQRGEL